MYCKNNTHLLERYFSSRISEAVNKSGILDDEKISEIRLRTDAPVSVRSMHTGKFLNYDGTLSTNYSKGIICLHDDMEYIFTELCEGSVHSYERELSEGFITLPGGHRAGISGTAVIESGKIRTVRNINSINIRIARQINGCSDEICRRIFDNGPEGVIISGPPGSGKTTLLRDICRNLGRKYRVSVIDERSEIAAVYQGEPQNDVGPFTDIFDGYPKKYAIEKALRVMSPDVIVCDEIGDRNDIKALLSSVDSGVRIIASVHAGSTDEVLRRSFVRKLVNSGGFRFIVHIGKERTCTIHDVLKNGRKEYDV